VLASARTGSISFVCMRMFCVLGLLVACSDGSLGVNERGVGRAPPPETDRPSRADIRNNDPFMRPAPDTRARVRAGTRLDPDTVNEQRLRAAPPAERDFGSELRAAIGDPGACGDLGEGARTISASAYVSSTGRVTSANVSGLPPEASRCLRERILRHRFQAPVEDAPRQVSTRFALRGRTVVTQTKVAVPPPPPRLTRDQALIGGAEPAAPISMTPAVPPPPQSGMWIQGPDGETIDGPSGQTIDGPSGTPIGE